MGDDESRFFEVNPMDAFKGLFPSTCNVFWRPPTNVPGVTKECFLEALEYLKTFIKHPFETPGMGFSVYDIEDTLFTQGKPWSSMWGRGLSSPSFWPSRSFFFFQIKWDVCDMASCFVAIFWGNFVYH